MKRLTGTILALVLAVGMLLSAMPAQAEQALPAVGDSIHGFTVTEVATEEIIDAPRILLTHDKTGAQVIYYAADDVNCSFDISFRTPNLNSKGIPHVFEHITISGSEKYPSQSLFFPVATQMYTTFINAMTYPTATTYPIGSMSEDQLLLLADYYLDGVFNPMVYTEERLYRREAWRYSLESEDAPLTLTGTVYNEMRGNDTIQSAALYDLLDALYPDSILSNVNGGDPDVIPEMTWEDLTDFHDAYYHPSNALVILYGDMDYTRFLELMDSEYFSQYDRREMDIETGEVPAQEGLVERVEEFPVEAGSPSEDASIIQYAFVANDIELGDTIDLSMLTSVLNHDASPLSEAVRQTLPGTTFYATIDHTLPDPYIEFYIEGVDADDMQTFRELVDTALVEMAGGINPEIVDAVLASEEFAVLLIPEQSQMGINMSINTMVIWSVWDTFDYYNVYFEKMAGMREEGYFEALIEKYLLDNPHAALVATVPAPGKAEEKAAALAEKLAAVKAEMTEEEVAQLVVDSAAMDAWSLEEAPKELLAALTAVTADTLPEEMKMYDIAEAEEDGVSIMTAQAAVGPIGWTQMYLDSSMVPQDKLHYLALYSALLGEVDTEQYTREELQTKVSRYLNGFSTSASAVEYSDLTYQPTYQASWMSLMDEYETGLELVREILFHSKFDDLDIIQNVIGQQKVGQRNSINNASYLTQMMRAESALFESSAYVDELGGLSYFDFLSVAEKMIADDPETLIAELEGIQAMLANKQNAQILFGGNEESIAIFGETYGQLFEGVEAVAVEPAVYAFDKPAAREGIVVDSAVQYNLLFDSLENLGIEYSAKLQPLSTVIYDGYLTPQIRHGIGAYDNITLFTKHGIGFISYRDPSVTETYAVYDGLPAYAETVEMSQEDLDRYIVSAYSSYALPQGELVGAMSAMGQRQARWPDDEKLIRMREMKETTVEDLRNLAPVFEKLLENGMRSTSGGAAVINENAELFDEIITVQGATE